MHRLWPRLNDVQFTIWSVLCPFNIHRSWGVIMFAVMRLDQHGLSGEIQGFIVINATRSLHLSRHRRPARPSSIGALAINQLDRLCPNPPPQHIIAPLLQCWFVDQKFVRISDPLHDCLTQPPDAADHDHIAAATFGIERENHPDDARSARIMRWTPTDKATLWCAKPLSIR